MYPLTYYETFMRYERSDQVFVAMPFTKPFQKVYKDIIEPAIGTIRIADRQLLPRIINRGTTGSPDIHEQILDAILHSRVVLADMTVQSQYRGDDYAKRWQPNANVTYEVGIACAWRNPEDILLIHQVSKKHTYSFDVQNLRHFAYSQNSGKSVSLIAEEIRRTIDRSGFLAKRMFKKIVESLSPSTIQFMHIESQRVFPVITFKGEKLGLHSSTIQAITELLSYGALRNRNVLRYDNTKKVSIVYSWTELGLRLLLAIFAIDEEQLIALSNRIASFPDRVIPPTELMTLPSRS